MTTSSDTDGEGNAQRLVGKFLQSFALLEQAMDQGIAELLLLEADVSEIIGATVPFTQKVSILFSSESVLGELPDNTRSKALKAVRSRLMALNDVRKMFAHNTFEAQGDGVQFRRAVASNRLKIEDVFKSASDVDSLCGEAAQLGSELTQLINETKPYVLKADFRDPRNSVLLGGGIL